MRWTEVLQGLRRMRFEDIYGRWRQRRLSQAEAAEILGMSERTFRRWRDRYEDGGVAGLLDRRLGQASSRRTPVDQVERVLSLYLPEHNARFGVAPEQPETAFVADQAGAHRDILCVQEERVVGNDNCVRYRGLSLQIPPGPLRPHFVRAKVRVHDYPDGTLAVFHGPRCLARYRADGTLLGADQTLAA